MRKPVFAYANNKGAAQTAHPPCSLISTFVICFFDSIMLLVSMYEISYLQLASVAELAGLYLTLSETPKTGFPITKFICNSIYRHWRKYLSQVF